MKKLPTPIKWLILLLTFVAIFGLLHLIDVRATQVDLPAPESWITAGRN